MKKISYPLILLLLVLWSCRKEYLGIRSEAGILKTVLREQRLTFASGTDFQNHFQKLKSIESKNSLLSIPSQQNFYSLLQFETQTSEDRMIAIMDDYLLSKQKSEIFKADQKTGSLVYSILLSELIESDAIKSLVNPQGEVQIGDSLYKISPYGTFASHIKNEAELRETYQQIAHQNNIAIRVTEPNAELKLNNIMVRKSAQSGLIILNNLVYFSDTFRDQGQSYSAPPFLPDGEDGGGGGGGGSPPPPPQGNDDPFSDMKQDSVEFKKEHGASFWDTILRNHTKYRKIDSRYRISVLFYNRNYIAFNSLGIKVKLQKRGLLWWNKTAAEEIIAGWERIVYKQKNLTPAFSIPVGEPPVFYSPYLINPYENPVAGWFSQTKAGLFQWKYAKTNQELFSIIIPDFLLPPTVDDVTIKSSDLKTLIPQAWNKLKQILIRSIPQAPLGNRATYKFPVHDIATGETKFYTIDEIEKMTKTLPSAPGLLEQYRLDKKIRHYLGPRQERKSNVAKIEYDLDFSTATISLSYNLASPISVKRVLNSLSISNMDNNFNVEVADVFGTVKHRSKWIGIRLKVKTEQ